MGDFSMKGAYIGKTVPVQAHPYPGATGNYAENDVIGSQMTWEVIRGPSNGTLLLDVVVTDKDDNKAKLYLVLLNRAIQSSDVVDNTAGAIVDSDADAILGTVTISTGSYVDLGGMSVATVTTAIALSGDSDRLVHGYLQYGGSGTPTLTTDGLIVSLGVSED